MELKEKATAKLFEQGKDELLEDEIGEVGPEKRLEGLDKDLLQQAKNMLKTVSEGIPEVLDSETEALIEEESARTEGVDLTDGANKKEKRRSGQLKRAALIMTVLAGMMVSFASKAEAKNVISDTISILMTGQTEDQRRTTEAAGRRVYNNAVNRSERAKDVMFQEWSKDVRNQRSNMRSNPADKKIEAANWKLVQEALNNLKKDPRYNGNEQGRMDAGQKILDDYNKRISGLK